MGLEHHIVWRIPFAADSGTLVDALILLHTYNGHLLHFAAECARYAPHAPALPQFDSSKIISLTPQAEGRTGG
jgi:hypothetical protein